VAREVAARRTGGTRTAEASGRTSGGAQEDLRDRMPEDHMDQEGIPDRPSSWEVDELQAAASCRRMAAWVLDPFLAPFRDASLAASSEGASSGAYQEQVVVQEYPYMKQQRRRMKRLRKLQRPTQRN
jgi:hypothetical protein